MSQFRSRLDLKLQSYLLIGLIGLGIGFRIANLDQKIFWVDEVATAIRAVGYTKAEVIAQLATGQPHSPADLLAYQQLHAPQLPARSFSDSLHALSRSPEHAPLYFLLVRLWMQLFGSSVSAIRSLSVLCSLLSLPALYSLCRELLGREAIGQPMNRAIAQTAVGFLAISPFFISYAQEARPYSLWLLMLLLCSTALLRALRQDKLGNWLIYALTLTLSLYSSLLSVFVAMGQAVYLGLQVRRSQAWRYLGRYLIAASLAGALFLPWVWVLWSQRAALDANTTWMRTASPAWLTLAIWIYSIAVLWFDLPVVTTGWIAAVEALLAATVLAIVAGAIVRLMYLPPRIGLALATLGLAVPMALWLIDLGWQGQVAATSRYLIPAQLALLIATAIGIMQFGQRTRRIALSVLLSLSLMSGIVNLNRIPDYQKDRNRANPELAAVINAEPAPILLAEPSQSLDLLSLSHSLDPATQIRIAPFEQLLPASATLCPPCFLFNPSEAMLAAAVRLGLNPSPIYQPRLLLTQDNHLMLWRACSDQNF